MGLSSVLNWLRGRFSSGRAIFEYRDGTRTWFGLPRVRRIDPFEACRLMYDQPDFKTSDLNNLGAPVDSETALKWRLDSIRAVASCARAVFGVKSLAEGGLTDDEACRLLIEFTRYMGIVKKNGEPPPNSPPSVEPTQEATKGDSASGSIVTTSEPETPSGSPPETVGPGPERSVSTAG
jgi:hypothetical protein